jgi:hypothetical protein
MMSGVETRLDGSTLIVRIPMRFQRRGGRKRIVAPDGGTLVPAAKPQPDGTLVKALARAWRWQRQLDDGIYTSVSEIAHVEGVDKGYISRILRLALLAPTIVEVVLECRSLDSTTLASLSQPMPVQWEDQLKRFGLGRPWGVATENRPV